MRIVKTATLMQSELFMSVKCGQRAVPARHALIRDALVQATLDPATQSIEYLPNIPTAPPNWNVDAIVIGRDDGRFHLDIVETRPRRSIAGHLMIAQALLELGLRPLVRTETDVMREPRCTNARTIFEYAGRPIDVGLRLQILGVLNDEGEMPLGELLGRVRSHRDPATAVMALACADLIELEIANTPLGPRTMTKLRQ